MGVGVAGGETEAATAFITFDGPGYHVSACGGVGADSKEWGETVIIGNEPEVEVEFVAELKRLDAAEDGVGRGGGKELEVAGFDFGEPLVGGIAALVIEVGTEPVEEPVAALLGGEEEGVMEGDEAATAAHLTREHPQAVTFEQGVGFGVVVGSVGEEDDGIGVVEGEGIGGPALAVEFDREFGRVGGGFEGALQEGESLFVFVVTGAVAFGAGEEDDLFWGRGELAEADAADGGGGLVGGDAERDVVLDFAGSHAEAAADGPEIDDAFLVDPGFDLVVGDADAEGVIAAGGEVHELAGAIFGGVHAVHAGDADEAPAPTADDEGAIRFADGEGEGAEEVAAGDLLGFDFDFVVHPGDVIGPGEAGEDGAHGDVDFALDDLGFAGAAEGGGFPSGEGGAVEEGAPFAVGGGGVAGRGRGEGGEEGKEEGREVAEERVHSGARTELRLQETASGVGNQLRVEGGWPRNGACPEAERD